MSKIASYLQKHLRGEIASGEHIRHINATDGSILTLTPDIVLYPFDVTDVRKVAKFCSQLAEKGHPLSLTSRGFGNSRTGAAIGGGVVINFPTHFNRILEIDTKQQLVRLQPGVGVTIFQDTMKTHGAFLPGTLYNYTVGSVGGAISNNTSGRDSVKYGSIADSVDQLEVVLANGELIQTGRINKRELDRKKGLPTLEGDIYRTIDGLIVDNESLLAELSNQRVNRNAAGYNIDRVKQKDGSFDLTPLFVGSQGSLGIITEMIVRTSSYNPSRTLFVISFNNRSEMHDTADTLRALEPSAMEFVDRSALTFAVAQNVNPSDIFVSESDTTPEALLFVEFNDSSDRLRKKKAKKVAKLLRKTGIETLVTSDPSEQSLLWQVYGRIVGTLSSTEQSGKVATPIIDDAAVPFEEFENYLKAVDELATNNHVDLPVWGHAGDGIFHVKPLLDMHRLTDRQRTLKLMDEYYELVTKLGGSVSASYGEGRLRASVLDKQFSIELISLFEDVKNAFDPQGILNPGVKSSASTKDLVPLLRDKFSEKQVDTLPLL